MAGSRRAQVHCLRQHAEPRRLEFLPYHFLLASIGRTGMLRYTDVTSGQLVSEMRSKLGVCDRWAVHPFSALRPSSGSRGHELQLGPRQGLWPATRERLLPDTWPTLTQGAAPSGVCSRRPLKC